MLEAFLLFQERKKTGGWVKPGKRAGTIFAISGTWSIPAGLQAKMVPARPPFA